MNPSIEQIKSYGVCVAETKFTLPERTNKDEMKTPLEPVNLRTIPKKTAIASPRLPNMKG